MSTRIHLDEARAPDVDVTLRELLHVVDEGVVQGFAAPVRDVASTGALPTLVTWWQDSGRTKRVADKALTYSGALATSVVRQLYDRDDGVTVVLTVTDTITYSGAVETDRARVIS